MDQASEPAGNLFFVEKALQEKARNGEQTLSSSFESPKVGSSLPSTEHSFHVLGV
jgi:hypothetical protein